MGACILTAHSAHTIRTEESSQPRFSESSAYSDELAPRFRPVIGRVCRNGWCNACGVMPENPPVQRRFAPFSPRYDTDHAGMNAANPPRTKGFLNTLLRTSGRLGRFCVVSATAQGEGRAKHDELASW